MVVGETMELFIVFGSIILSLGLLVVIDRLGTLRRGELEGDEEDI